MAPTGNRMKNKHFQPKEGNWKKSQHNAQAGYKKKKWTPENKVFEGSVKEGQGFALKRKEKVKHEYNKLLRKERRRTNPGSTALFKEDYPEHLRHLYVAEAQKLKNEAWTNRMNRTMHRMKGRETVEETAEDVTVADPEKVPEVTDVPEQTDSVTVDPETTTTTTAAAAPEKNCLPVSNRMKKKIQKKTSYQKTKEEFETVKEKQKNKKEEFLKQKQQREEAIQKYKQKKLETFQILSKKTKRGQPNLNLQMDYLLQKIQGTGK